MSLTVGTTGQLFLTDSQAGSTTQKALTASFAGTFFTSVQSQNIGVGSTTITLPASPTTVVYIKNLHASQTVTVTWTPNGGASATIATLQPGGVLYMNEASASSGITALSLAASGASTNVEYWLLG